MSNHEGSDRSPFDLLARAMAFGVVLCMLAAAVMVGAYLLGVLR